MAENRLAGNRSVTLCTHATHELLSHVATLCRRWQAPMSVAVYAPGHDLVLAARQVAALRTCGDTATCVRTYISFHVYFDAAHPPPQPPGPTGRRWPIYVDPTTCPTSAPAVPSPPPIRSYKAERGLPYPINVGRNVARLMARTHFMLSADVELFPSRAIAPMFLAMIRRGSSESALRRRNPRVFVLPIFEVVRSVRPPSSKAELIRLYKARQAVFFHKYVCPACSLPPRLAAWLVQRPNQGRMAVFHVAKRHPPFHRWEPVYIGTHADPLYDERLTWEGRQDKMSQMHALCLMDYDLDILDNAFLVHAPGIKRMSVTLHTSHREFLQHNDLIHQLVVKELNEKYGERKYCG